MSSKRTFPRCGGRKHRGSETCRMCWHEKHGHKSQKITLVCPDCGGPKSHGSMRCHKCAGVGMIGNTAGLTCACGGVKAFGAEQCVTCYNSRRRKDALENGCQDFWQEEARRAAEESLGRLLMDGEAVHHINMDETNNSPENLFVCPNPGYHRWLHHHYERAYAEEHFDVRITSRFASEVNARWEARRIIEGVLGRPLRHSEVVHHINLAPFDNRNCNLVMCEGLGHHQLLHYQYQKAFARTATAEDMVRLDA